MIYELLIREDDCMFTHQCVHYIVKTENTVLDPLPSTAGQ